eukprot:1310182-Pleurochrysis_carterae.AAC.1
MMTPTAVRVTGFLPIGDDEPQSVLCKGDWVPNSGDFNFDDIRGELYHTNVDTTTTLSLCHDYAKTHMTLT